MNMKRYMALSIAVVILLFLTACGKLQSSAELQSSVTAEISESKTTTQSSETETILSETVSLTTSEAIEATTETTAEIVSETPTSQSETAAETTAVAVATTAETTTAPKPKENKFIDFEITELKGIADIGKLADKAVEFLKTTDEYRENIDNINEFSNEEFDAYISNGKIIPKIIGAYPDDYDGDGKIETFIMLELPCINDYSYKYAHKFFIFADSSDNMTLLDNIPENLPVSLLNYGNYKQIIFGGFSPYANVEEHYLIYGVKNGQAELLYTSQMNYKKEKCFLLAPNKWGHSIMMYYDLKKGKYVNVSNKKMSVSEIQKMDKAGNIKNEYYRCFLVGNKFYVIYDSYGSVSGTYTYENGKFVDAGFWLYINWDNSDSEEIDYDKAVSSMTGLLY